MHAPPGEADVEADSETKLHRAVPWFNRLQHSATVRSQCQGQYEVVGFCMLADMHDDG